MGRIFFSLSEKSQQDLEIKSVPQSVIHLAKRLSKEGKEKEKDYGSAVVDYLKKIDSSLSKTDLGNKIKTFIESMDPSFMRTSTCLVPNIRGAISRCYKKF